MSTRSNSSHLFSPLLDPESLIRRRSLGDPSSLFDFEEVMNNYHNQEPPPHNGLPPMVRPNGQASRMMEELCQPSINGRGRPIAPIPIQATDFGLRHHMIQQVQNTCQFHRLPGDDANRHIDKFLEITQHMKQNEVSDDALHVSLFPYSLTHHAIAWYDRLPRNSIHSFDDMMTKFLSKYFPPSIVTKLRNEITKFEQKPHESLFKAWERYKLSIDRCLNHNMLLVRQINTDTSAIRDETSRNISSTSTTESPEVVRQLEMMNKNFSEMTRQFQTVKAIDKKCETCGGPHSFTECPTVSGYTQETAYATMGTGSLPCNTVPKPQEDLKAITNRSGVTLAGPSVSPHPLSKEPSPAFTSFSTISSSKMPEVTKDTVQPSTENIQPPVKLREKDDNLALKFVEIFRNLHFELSFANALMHMPKFGLMFKSLLNNKEKLFDLATTPVNENCSAVILKKLLEKLGDPGKTGRALIDVYAKELTLRVDDEAITFKVGQTLKYSYNDVESINRIDVIDVACDFILEEIEAFLTSESIPPGIDDTNLDLEGDIHLLEDLLNNDPSLSPLPPKELNVE
nr:hypothetical protein [Tanacetum cinerariifolium]